MRLRLTGWSSSNYIDKLLKTEVIFSENITLNVKGNSCHIGLLIYTNKFSMIQGTKFFL